jgi:hypothetical protein
MKKLTIGIAAIVIAAGSYLAFMKYNENQFISSLAPHVKNASIRISNSSRLELEPSQATFKELFDRLDTDVAEIEKHVVEVQSSSTEKTAAISAPVVAYLQAAQEFARAQSMKYRKRLAFRNAVDRSDDAIRDLRSASSYGSGYALERSKKSLDELTKANEEFESSVKEFVVAAKNMRETESKISQMFPQDALVQTKQLDDIIERNTVKPDKSAKVDK